jgi:hypothetical protein
MTPALRVLRKAVDAQPLVGMGFQPVMYRVRIGTLGRDAEVVLQGAVI